MLRRKHLPVSTASKPFLENHYWSVKMQKHQYIYKRCQGQPTNSGEGLNFQISMTFRLLILHITSASISSRLYKARFPVD